VGPVAPVGRTKLKVCAGAVPVIVAAAVAPPVTVPIESELVGPVGPVTPWIPCGPWSFEITTEISGCDSATTIISVAPVCGSILTIVLLVGFWETTTVVSLILSRLL
jgi:hypothetical protein